MRGQPQPLFALGWVLFGAATVRAGVLPAWPAAALVIGAAVSFLPVPFSPVVLAVAVGYLGYCLVHSPTGASQPV